MALVREYPVNSVIAQRSAAEAVDVSVVSASATGEQTAAPDRRQAQSRIVEALLRRCIFTKTAAKSLLWAEVLAPPLAPEPLARRF